MRVESGPLEIDFRPLVIHHRPLRVIRKNKCSLVSTHILLKNAQFLNTTVLSSPFFVKKTLILPKQNSLMSFFFQIIPEKPPAVKPILIKPHYRSEGPRQGSCGVFGGSTTLSALFTRVDSSNDVLCHWWLKILMDSIFPQARKIELVKLKLEKDIGFKAN